VESLDIVEDIGSSLGPSPIPSTPDPISLQETEETLSRCVVCASADCTHAADHVVAGKEEKIAFCDLLLPFLAKH
jgi:hypothetical protein